MEIDDFSQLTLLNKWNAVTSNGELTPTGAAAIQAGKMKTALTTGATSAASGTSAISPISSSGTVNNVTGAGTAGTVSADTSVSSSGIAGITDSAERVRQMTANEASLQGAEKTDAASTLNTTDSSFTELLTKALSGSESSQTASEEEYSQLAGQLGRSVLSQLGSTTSSSGTSSSLSSLSSDLLGTSGGRKVMSALIDGQLSASAMTESDNSDDSSDTGINGNGFGSLM